MANQRDGQIPVLGNMYAVGSARCRERAGFGDRGKGGIQVLSWMVFWVGGSLWATKVCYFIQRSYGKRAWEGGARNRYLYARDI